MTRPLRTHPTGRLVAAAMLLLAGCGGSAAHSGGSAARSRGSAAPNGGAAEPAIAPPVARPPAGRVLSVGGMPEGIVFDPGTGLVAVGLRNPARLALIDLRTLRLTRTVMLAAGPRHLQLEPNASVVLVSEEDARVLAEVSLPSGSTTATVRVGRQPHDATFGRGRVFVGDEFAGAVSVIAAGRVVATVGGLRQPGGLAAAGRTIAVVDVGAHTVSTFDALTLHPDAILPAGTGPTHVVVDSLGRLVVVGTRDNSLDLYSAKPLTLLSRIPLPGTPYGIATDQARRRLWITLTATNQVVELAVTSRGLRRVATFPTGRQPNTVTVDTANGDAVVANRADGTIEVIRPAA